MKINKKLVITAFTVSVFTLASHVPAVSAAKLIHDGSYGYKKGDTSISTRAVTLSGRSANSYYQTQIQTPSNALFRGAGSNQVAVQKQKLSSTGTGSDNKKSFVTSSSLKKSSTITATNNNIGMTVNKKQIVIEDRASQTSGGFNAQATSLKTKTNARFGTANIVVANGSQTGNNTSATTTSNCPSFIPPGHLIAPGFLKHNGRIPAQCLPPCWSLPPGIAKKLSNCTSTTTPPIAAPVIANVNSSVTSSTTATITWQTNQLSNSMVIRATSTPIASATSMASTSSASLVTSHQILLTGLVPNTLYFYEVSSTNASGLTSTSSVHSFMTPAVVVSEPVITNVGSIVTSTTTATITWQTDQLSNGMVLSATSTPIETASSMTSTSSPSLVASHQIFLTGLTPNTLYYFKVSSSNSNGTATSSVYSFTTLAVPPPVMSNFTVSNITSNSAKIKWNTDVPANSGIYFAKSAPVLTSPTMTSMIFPTLVTSHEIDLSGLESATSYFVLVTSTDSFGHTSTSSTLSFPTL